MPWSPSGHRRPRPTQSTGRRILVTCRLGGARRDRDVPHRDAVVPDAAGVQAPGSVAAAILWRSSRPAPRRRPVSPPGDDRRSCGARLDRRGRLRRSVQEGRTKGGILPFAPTPAIRPLLSRPAAFCNSSRTSTGRCSGDDLRPVDHAQRAVTVPARPPPDPRGSATRVRESGVVSGLTKPTPSSAAPCSRIRLSDTTRLEPNASVQLQSRAVRFTASAIACIPGASAPPRSCRPAPAPRGSAIPWSRPRLVYASARSA